MSLSFGEQQEQRRRKARYRVQAPLDVTVLRSGIPDTFPGRSLNMGEGGIAAMLAGELQPGEPVGLEIELPMKPGPLRTRALVRHHDRLRCGLEFVGLSPEQHAALRGWASGVREGEVELGPRSLVPGDTDEFNDDVGKSQGSSPPPAERRYKRRWIFALPVAAMLLGAGWWWHWNRGWEALESGLHGSAVRPQASVSADVMQKLVIHRVDPDYPIAARAEKLQGAIVLDVVVGSDGSVLEVHALNGPEVLARAATDALRWWRFSPYRINGQPVTVNTTVAVDFKP